MSLPSLDEIKDADEEFWRWVFSQNDGSNHPVKISSGGKAQTKSGRILIIAGALSGQPNPIQMNRSLQIPPQGIDYIFVPADNCVYTQADGDGGDAGALVGNANRDMASGTGSVSVNDNSQALNLLPGHPFTLDIQKCIKESGKSKNGEGCTSNTPPGGTLAASACHYALIRATALRSNDKIRITGEAGTGIDVTYTVL